MELLITDNLKHFGLSNCNYKVLVKDWKICSCNFLDEITIQNTNLSFLSIEMPAAHSAHAELRNVLETLKGRKFTANKALKTRDNYNINYSLLYTNFWHFVIRKHVTRLISKKVVALAKAKSVSFFLSEEYLLCKELTPAELTVSSVNYKFYKDSGTLMAKAKKKIKNIVYWLSYTLKTGNKQVAAPGKPHILLLLFDVASMHSALKTFIELIKNRKDLHLSIVEITSGISRHLTCSVKEHECDNIKVYNYTDFRTPNFISHTDFYNALSEINANYKIFRRYDLLANIEVHYSWMSTMFKKINPTVALMPGLTEVSRIFSDTARRYNIPSVNLQYGMIADDPYLVENNIEFTARALIGSEASEIWRKRKDPTPIHEIIGFCKLDELNNFSFIDKEKFFETHHFDQKAKTIFFASSWANSNKTYDIEKENIIMELSTLCHRKQWNFIIKKHPSEVDNKAEEILKKNNFPFQKVFSHKELSLYDAINMSDFVTSLPSSIIYEVLCMNKPFCFVAKNEENNLISYFNISKENEIRTFFQIDATEQFIENSFKMPFVNDSYSKLIERYLYKNDRNASGRLIQLLLTIKITDKINLYR